MTSEPVETTARVPLTTLFFVFFRIGLTSFGGSTAAWLYKEVVQRRRWLTEEGFITALTVSQVLPGANPVNMSIYVGSQLRGGLGGAAAAIGLVGPPFVVALLLAFLYQRFGDFALVHSVLAGLAAVGVGMTVTMGTKLAQHVRKPVPILIALIAFGTVGILRWPMLPVVLVLTPLSIALEFYAARKRPPP